MERTSSVILNAHGEPATVPTLLIDPADVQILRAYKKVLQKLGLREALYCNTCWNHQRADGLDAHVTDSQVVLRCRCTLRFYSGQSY